MKINETLTLTNIYLLKKYFDNNFKKILDSKKTIEITIERAMTKTFIEVSIITLADSVKNHEIGQREILKYDELKKEINNFLQDIKK